jgi:hypothetical protein
VYRYFVVALAVLSAKDTGILLFLPLVNFTILEIAIRIRIFTEQAADIWELLL